MLTTKKCCQWPQNLEPATSPQTLRGGRKARDRARERREQEERAARAHALAYEPLPSSRNVSAQLRIGCSNQELEGAGAFGNHVNHELIAMPAENAKLHAQDSRLEAEPIKLQTELRELRDNKRTAPILPMRAAQ